MIFQSCNCPSYKTYFVYFICSVFRLPNNLKYFQLPLDFIAEIDCRLFKGIWLLISIAPQLTAVYFRKIDFRNWTREGGATTWRQEMMVFCKVACQWQFHYLHRCYLPECSDVYKIWSLMSQLLTLHQMYLTGCWIIQLLIWFISLHCACFITVVPKFRFPFLLISDSLAFRPNTSLDLICNDK